MLFDSALTPYPLVIGLWMSPSPPTARQWFPCIDGSDKTFTAEFKITVDYDLVALCSGDLISQATTKHTCDAWPMPHPTHAPQANASVRALPSSNALPTKGVR